MARRKKRRNPDTFSAKNIVIALAAGSAVYLLIRELKKRGMLGENGDGYGVKKAEPVIKPTVVAKLAATKAVIPVATRGPLVPVYQALTALEQQKQKEPQMRAGVTAATAKLNAALVNRQNVLSTAKTPEAARMRAEEQDRLIKSLQENVGKAESAYKASPFLQQLNQKYADALAAAKAAARDERGLRNEYGDRAEVAIKQLRGALLESGDEEFATTEGAVDRPQ